MARVHDLVHPGLSMQQAGARIRGRRRDVGQAAGAGRRLLDRIGMHGIDAGLDLHRRAIGARVAPSIGRRRRIGPVYLVADLWTAVAHGAIHLEAPDVEAGPRRRSRSAGRAGSRARRPIAALASAFRAARRAGRPGGAQARLVPLGTARPRHPHAGPRRRRGRARRLAIAQARAAYSHQMVLLTNDQSCDGALGRWKGSMLGWR
jgi:hypothetical protein